MTFNRRQTLTTLLAAAVAAPAASALARQAGPTAQPPMAPVPSDELLARARAALVPGGLVEELIDRLVEQGRFSGVILAAIDGRPVLHRAYGLADRAANRTNALDTRFNIASAGKMFTTVGIGQLLETGQLRLDDRLADHLPEFRPDIGARITIAQLLSHTSGLGSYFGSPLWNDRRGSLNTLEDFLALIEGEPLQFAPGERYEYSNSGFTLLGAVIQKYAGKDYYTAMQERVFAPAGMTKTGYPTRDDASTDIAAPYTNGCFMRPPTECTPGDWRDARPMGGRRGGPAGGGHSTAGDLNAFAEALKTGRLLKPETLNRLKAEQLKTTRRGGPIDAVGLGFGRLTVHGQPSWGHNGGTVGAQAQLDVFEDAPLTLVVLANQDEAQRPASSALRRAAAPPGWTPPTAQPGAGPVMVRPGG